MVEQLADITLIVTNISSALTSLGVLPFVFAGVVIGLVGRFIMAAKKAGR